MGFVSRAVLVALPLASGLALASMPAWAQQDSVSQQLDDIRNAVGFGKAHAPIDFTERPPLVVPPTDTLPPPGTAADEKLPVVDPDISSRRKALSDPRRPVPPTDPGAAATGRDARVYLIDPPTGMRDPDSVAAETVRDKAALAETKPRKRHHARRRAHAVKAAQ